MSLRFSRSWAPALGLAAALFLVVPPAVDAAPSTNASPPDSAERQVARFGFADTEVGFVLRDLKTGATLAAHLPDQVFIPASVAKVGTAVAALEVLGADHRFTTRVLVDGPVEGDTLRGSVYLQGGGDPLLDNGALRHLAQSLAAAGIRRVKGRFVYDESSLPAYNRIDALQPDAASYNPGISALSLNFNRVELQWQREKNETFSAVTNAISDGLVIPVESFAFGAADARLPGGAPFMRSNGSVGSDGEEADWVFDPSLADKGYAWLPVHEAGITTARVFRSIAEGVGVTLPEPEPGVTPASARVSDVSQSRALPEVLRLLLKHSNNLTAELIGLNTARALAGRTLPLDQANAEVGRWYAGLLPGAGWVSYAPLNFSGLTSAGRVTPDHIAAILARGARGNYGGVSLVDLMPARSVDVVEEVQVRTKATKKRKSRVTTVNRSKKIGTSYAKTGTMAYVRGLAGYLDAASGRRLVFAVFVNDPAERAALDASPAVRSPIPPPGSRRWLGRARGLEQALLQDWAKRY